MLLSLVHSPVMQVDSSTNRVLAVKTAIVLSSHRHNKKKYVATVRLVTNALEEKNACNLSKILYN